MSGNKVGGEKTREKLLSKDPDYYKKIGSIGGKKSVGGGFASKEIGNDGLTGYERARIVGKKGGKISRRSKKSA